MNPVLLSPKMPAPADSSAASTTASSGSGFSFHDLLDIVNPLQHLPVIGTLYRAITGDKMGAVEKVAGDTLYGGVWGAVSSIADLAFEQVTGKDFGSTVLALFTGPDDAKAAVKVADATPVAPKANDGADVAALATALQKKGVEGGLAQRALQAYRQSMSLPDMALHAAQ